MACEGGPPAKATTVGLSSAADVGAGGGVILAGDRALGAAVELQVGGSSPLLTVHEASEMPALALPSLLRPCTLNCIVPWNLLQEGATCCRIREPCCRLLKQAMGSLQYLSGASVFGCL